MSILAEIKDIKSGRKELRQFGLTIGVVLGLLGGWILYRGKLHATAFLIVGGAFLLLAFILPVALKPLQKIWMTIAVVIGWVMTRVILIVLFYFVVTPIGVIGRLCGKQFLDKTFQPGTETSHWIKRMKRVRPGDCERQF